MAEKTTKLFVLDTNVILHDSACLHQFKHHDVVIPITVIEELDKFKKGNETLNFHARHFLKELDKISSEGVFNGGIPIAKNKGLLILKLDQRFHPDLKLHFESDKPDHKILNCAYYLSKENPGREVTLVTKDVNLRVKAKAVHLISEDYTTDHVKDISTIYKGYRFEENVSREVINRLCHDAAGVSPKKFKSRSRFHPNEYIVARNKEMSALGYVDPTDMMVKHITKVQASGIKPRNVEQMFALHALMNENIRLVTITGKAGTGKTLLALAAALEQKENYKQIFLSRPIVALSNKDLGYLPGGVDEKVGPYMQPLYDNLGVIQDRLIDPTERRGKKFQKMLDEQQLVISPLAYIRGRSLVDTYFIVDEAQNLTPHEIKTIITRAGENTKMVFCGDIFQIDHPYLDIYSNGLSYLIDKMQGQKLYTHIFLEKGERSELAEIASDLL
ncbi:MAG: PhoH family protein [Candidatus Omnitrophica bacterium]|nr:PhoH family protein [Candidatus Omnitrophota bacterium]